MPAWKDKVVVVAGGSRGFGLQIARAFAERQSQVVLLARSPTGLESGLEQLRIAGAVDPLGIEVDLADEEQLNRAVSAILNRHEKIDVWVNAVGQSTRTALDAATAADFRELMDQNFFASLNGSLAAIPELARTSGHLINIGSLASKTAWPWVAPYVTAKHALAGLTQQLRLEGPDNVHFLLVCPGPIAAESGNGSSRYSSQSTGLGESASKPGAGAPVGAIDGEALARRIIRACERRKPELVVPWKARLLYSISQLSPSLGDWLLRRLAK